MTKKEKKPLEISKALKKWFDPRVVTKLQRGLTLEQAWEDVVKDISVKILSGLPLEKFANAMSRLAQIDDSSRFHLIENLLAITPNPDNADSETTEKLQNVLLLKLSSADNGTEEATSMEIDLDFTNIAKNILQDSHRDWIGIYEVISKFLKGCTANFNSDKNIFIVYPHLDEISRLFFIEKEQRTSLEYFFNCVQTVANNMGFKFKDLIKLHILDNDKEFFKSFAENFFPKVLKLNAEDDPTKIHLTPPLIRPKWHNQSHLLMIVLQNAPNYSMLRKDLIDAALYLDKEICNKTGLPRCFTGRTPENSASSCITHVAEKYFIPFKKSPDSKTHYKLSFTPNDFDEFYEQYVRWTKRLTEHDWPLLFGKLKDNAPSDEKIFMLSVGIDTNDNNTCIRCVEKKDCDSKFPSCSRLQSETMSYIQTEEISGWFDLSTVPKGIEEIVEVRPSTIPNAGNGLFAKQDIPNTTPLGFFFGVPMLEEEFELHKDSIGMAADYSMRYKHTILDATDKDGMPYTDPKGKAYCPFHFMNENLSGNTVFLEGHEINQVVCWTNHDIKAGEELFVYYGAEVDRQNWMLQDKQENNGNDDSDEVSNSYELIDSSINKDYNKQSNSNSKRKGKGELSQKNKRRVRENNIDYELYCGIIANDSLEFFFDDED
ncbi:13630_t:CDS:2 [Entrophospora sp. SA101]|nr:13630_t:CDS:2 [Entrophospora sp. SA101]